MILEYSFSPKVQMGENLEELHISCLNYAELFEKLQKIKGLEQTSTDPSNLSWQIETNDPDEIKALKDLGFTDIKELYPDLEDDDINEVVNGGITNV